MSITNTELMRTIQTFSDERKLNGSNWLQYAQEFEMLFGLLDKSFWDLVQGKLARPADTQAIEQATWDQTNRMACVAIYKTVPVETIRASHCAPGKTAADWWKSLKGEFLKDSRSARLEMKHRLLNPVHDPSQPVATYIDGITKAANDLASIGREVDDSDIVDSIIMHLDDSWTTIKTILTAREDDLTPLFVRDQLIEHQRVFGKDELSDGTALYGRSGSYTRERQRGKSRRPAAPTRKPAADRDRVQSGSESDSAKEFRWLDPHNVDDCHRCGRRGHIARFCINDMPAEVKKQVLRDRVRYAHTAYLHAKGSASRNGVDVSDNDDDELAGMVSGSGFFTVENSDSDDDGLVTLTPARGAVSSGGRIRYLS